MTGVPELDVLFRADPRGKRRAIAYIHQKVVLLQEGNPLSAHVLPGERWRVRLYDHISAYIAEPLECISPQKPLPTALLPVTIPPAREQPIAVPIQLVGSLTNGEAAANGNGHHTGAAPPVALHEPRSPLRRPMEIGGMLLEPHNVIRSGERVAIFVDAANVESSARQLGFRIDYAKLLAYFQGGGDFAFAYYFTGDVGDDPSSHAFFRRLCDVGYTLRFRRAQTPRPGEPHRADLDVQLVMEMLESANNFDVAVLFSGDGDFVPAVRSLQQRGKRVYVAAARSNLSFQLAYAAHKPLFHLDDHLDILTREGGAHHD